MVLYPFTNLMAPNFQDYHHLPVPLPAQEPLGVGIPDFAQTGSPVGWVVKPVVRIYQAGPDAAQCPTDFAHPAGWLSDWIIICPPGVALIRRARGCDAEAEG